jgi:hypothetical protein
MRFLIVGLLGIAAYFVRGILHTVSALEESVYDLKTKVAVILDRDRRKRIGDYENENN